MLVGTRFSRFDNHSLKPLESAIIAIRTSTGVFGSDPQFLPSAAAEPPPQGF
jgi:hypothetical protein